MRAVVIARPGGPEVLEIREVATPEPQGEQVRVRVRAAGLNRADLAQRQGNYPAPPGSPADIPGMEFAGEVEALGPLARRWQPGQRVMGLVGGGAQAEYVVIHEGMLVAVPERLGDVEAAGVPEVFFTAHDALFTQAELRMGERVLISAAGSGVGTAAIQLAHAAGATVFGISRTPAKLERAQALGLDYAARRGRFCRTHPRADRRRGRPRRARHGRRALSQKLPSGTDRTRTADHSGGDGRRGDAAADLGAASQAACACRAACCATARSARSWMSSRASPARCCRCWPMGACGPSSTQTYPLDQIRAAHEAMAANTNFGKLMLTI